MWKPWCCVLGLMVALGAARAPAKEFLTPQEIAKIQDAQDIDARVKIYLAAAALRLKTAAERLGGKESTPGDPLEFFSVEDMLDGYYQILRSVMLNLDDASAKPSTDPKKIQAALKDLKSATEVAVRQLDALKRMAEEQRREEAWKLVGKAIEINNGAHEGAVAALAK
jgi:hypothetical protein